MVGNVLGNRYEVLERIGTGGMSLVYRARDITLNRLVAVKILKHQWAEDEEVVRRFEQEARSAASLIDRHIVQVYDVGRDEPDVHYMVMELVAGETLRAKIDREAPLAVDVALSIADQVAEGLEVAHARKVVHRDIKPQNVLMSVNGDVKVADFGIAYAATTGTLVNTGSLLGTVQYLSPEQARGKRIGPQSDLYSLGIVLFEMLTGQLPFKGDSAIGVAIKHLQDEPPRVNELRPEIPELVANIVERALSKDPADRYQSAHAFRQDISRALHPEQKEVLPEAAAPVEDNHEVSRRQSSKTHKKETKRRRWWVWIVLAVVLVLIGGGLLAFDRWLNPPLVAVPNVYGRPWTSAHKVFTDHGLKSMVVGHQSSAKIGTGSVLDEKPSAGTHVKSGYMISVILSSGPTPVSVPGVTGEDVSSATESLKVLGLKVLVHHINSHDSKGEVVRQSPTSGRSVRPGATVTLWVSNGAYAAQSLMPNLVGLTVSQAASNLLNSNMTVGTPSRQWSTQPINTIIDQSPAPYSSTSGVTSVSVTVSSGPSPVSAGMARHRSIVRVPIPSDASPKSLLKVVVTDQADNVEIFYRQVSPGQDPKFPVVWYGTSGSGSVTASLNGQPAPPQPLTVSSPSPSPSQSPSPSNNSPSPSSSAAGNG